MTGRQLQFLMCRHHVTIAELSARMGITQKRIRRIREIGLAGLNVERDWIEGITGTDPHSQEGTP